MRFISRHPGYTFCLQVEFSNYMQDGAGATVKNVIRPTILLEFSNRVGLWPWEMEAAMKHFKFDGVQLQEDMVTKFPVQDRISVLDTNEVANKNQMSYDEKTVMEDKLLNDQFYGLDFIMVEEPKVPAPWPTYDTFKNVQKLVEQVVALGFTDDESLDRVITYERQNQGRPEVMAELQKLKLPAIDEVLIEA